MGTVQMCEFLKKYIVRLCFGLTLFFTASIASATLMIGITDIGGGQTQWQFSGSVEAQSSSAGQASFFGVNWTGTGTDNPVASEYLTGLFNIAYVGESAWLRTTDTTTGVIRTQTIMNQIVAMTGGIITGRCDAVAGPGCTSLSWVADDTLSWGGDITVDLDFSNLNTGVYTTNQIQTGATTQNLNGGGIQLSITGGQAVTVVPEPSIIALFGLGLVGFGFARRRRQA